MRFLVAFVVTGLVATSTVSMAARAQQHLVYVGTYTGPGTNSQGIYAFRFDDGTGALTPLGLAADTPNPSFLTARPDGRVVFAVNEVQLFNGQPSGYVTSFAVDPNTGKLTPTSVQSSRGEDPCHLMLDRTGHFLAVANYTSGTFSVLPVAADGRLGKAATVLTHTGSGPNKDRQDGPHAHEVVFTGDNKFLFATDLGLDRLFVYRFTPSSGALAPGVPASADLAPGSGPRHLAWHPNGRFVFVISELASTITTFTWDAATGRLARGGSVSTLPAGFTGENTTAEIAVHPNGQFVYGSNRGHDSIAVFRVGTTGALSLVEMDSTRGQKPRHFTIDPSGRWLIAANQDSGTLAVFRLNPATGRLTPAGPLAPVGSPVHVLFVN